MPEPLSRRHFLEASGLGIAAAVVGSGLPETLASTPPITARLTPRQALARLIAGNRRWVTGRVAHPRQSIARRTALSHQQRPFATVLSCIDSRVPPELVFDQGIGDLAVVRTGAQVLDRGVVLGSIEFRPDELATPLILVMGHQRCGAVKAAIHTIQTGSRAPGHIQSVVDALRPAYRVAIKQRGDLLDNMVRAQTRLAVRRIRDDPQIAKSISRGELMVAGGYYSLDTGAVSLITP